MLAPDKVLLKRKRTEDPPNALLLARSDANSTPTKRIRYVLQSGEVTTGASTSSAQHKVLPRTRQARRRFQLRRAPAAKHDEVQDKRSHNDADDLPTFEAESRTIARQTRFDDVDMSDASSDAAPPIKRPGRGSALRSTTATTRRRSPDDGTGMAALAESMHEFALQELAKIPKPTRTSKPRMSPEQSKARHDRNMARQVFNDASKAEMMDMDDKDFVYDTYVLAVNDHMDTSPDENVGYLVIKEDDEEYWQTFLQQNEDEPDEEPDEEDENAEDYYAADYPEDDLASDDEHDENAYHYRPRANSDLEQWDHRAATNDEDDFDSACDAPIVKHWEAQLGIRRPGANGSHE